MANWDHLSNIGTHPILDSDPAVRLPVALEAAAYQVARHQHLENVLREQADSAGISVFDVRAAVSRGRQRVLEQVAAGELP